MPGFYVSNIKTDIALQNFVQERCIRQDLPGQDFIIKRNTLNKFLDDKVFSEDSQYICITDGFILNKTDLLKKHGCASLLEMIERQASGGDTTFFIAFRGSFSGALYDKAKVKWVFYTNHLGDQPLFYYFREGKYIVASQFNYVVDALRAAGIRVTLNERAAYNMLTYGYMPDSETYASEIRRMAPGSYIEISKDGIAEHTYYTACNTAHDLTDKSRKEIIDAIDVLFRNAVSLEFEKDREYGYRHIADLSGGLDSRMVSWVAKSMGYGDILNMSYGHTGCMDQQLSQEIAKKLSNGYLFKSLDDLSCLYAIDDTVAMNYGMTIYILTTGSRSMGDVLCTDKFGISHTGLLGDSILGTYAYRSDVYPETDRSIMYSPKLEDRVGYTRRYGSFDTECLYKRGIHGIMMATLIRRQYMEASSPFTNVEFLNYCLSIPLEMRRDHGIYLDWIKAKYPEAAAIVWDKTGMKPSSSPITMLLAKIKRHGTKRIAQMAGRKSGAFGSKRAMNPFALWYQESAELRAYLQSYFDSHIGCEILSERLREDMRMLYNTGTVQEKCQVLTALSAIKLYFSKEKA